jgi:DNA (cytosine-5)-methyltransferase 1
MFRFGSLASGIEAASVAWKPLGMQPAFFSEIDPFCNSLLTQRHSDAPNLGNMNEITVDALRRCGKLDCLVAGTPCQAFSIAGARGGIKDPRGQLALRAVQILEYTRPRWFVWENVDGVLSSWSGANPPSDLEPGQEWETQETSDFGQFLAAVVDLGYCCAWRVLDAQYWGLAQRRKRVFVVGCIGNWRDPATVLFESDSVPWNNPPSQGKRKDITGTITSRTRGGGGLGTDFECNGGLVPALTTSPYADNASEEGKLIVSHTLRGEGFDASEDGTGRGTPLVPVYSIQERAVSENLSNGPGGKGYQEGIAYTLEARHHVQAVAFSCKDYGADAGPISPTLRAMGHSGSHANAGGQVAVAFGGNNTSGPIDLATACNAKGGTGRSDFESETFVLQSAVRRITPRESERLQGFPDDYTLITHRGKPAADGPRYKAIGNSIAIPVLKWIGQRILMVDGSNQ